MLANSADRKEQIRLREFIRGSAEYYTFIIHAYFRNPFFHLLEDEVAFMASDQVAPGLRELLTARAAAAKSGSPKYAVFCMPKSGSSFVQTALQQALQVPFVSATSLAPPEISSKLGMNSREQEIDEFALMSAILASPRGFIFQSHTRYSTYLGRQLRHYRITPIVTIRNILDCIVSFDDMMIKWRAKAPAPQWRSDAQFALPADYQELPQARRHELLGPTFGTWLVNFYLSWKRGIAHGDVSPMLIRYEEDVVNPERFIDRMSAEVGLGFAECDRLARYVRAPDRASARLNVGRPGRGLEQLPQSVVNFLTNYVGAFKSEISDAEARMLLA